MSDDRSAVIDKAGPAEAGLADVDFGDTGPLVVDRNGVKSATASRHCRDIAAEFDSPDQPTVLRHQPPIPRDLPADWQHTDDHDSDAGNVSARRFRARSKRDDVSDSNPFVETGSLEEVEAEKGAG